MSAATVSSNEMLSSHIYMYEVLCHKISSFQNTIKVYSNYILADKTPLEGLCYPHLTIHASQG